MDGARVETGVPMEESLERDQVSELDQLMRDAEENGKRLRNWSKLETWDALLGGEQTPPTRPAP